MELEDWPSSYSEAKKLGVKYYFTGKECSKGHVSKRLVANCGCVTCTLLGVSNSRKTNKIEYRKKENLRRKNRLPDFKEKFPYKPFELRILSAFVRESGKPENRSDCEARTSCTLEFESYDHE